MRKFIIGIIKYMYIFIRIHGRIKNKTNWTIGNFN